MYRFEGDGRKATRVAKQRREMLMRKQILVRKSVMQGEERDVWMDGWKKSVQRLEV